MTTQGKETDCFRTKVIHSLNDIYIWVQMHICHIAITDRDGNAHNRNVCSQRGSAGGRW